MSKSDSTLIREMHRDVKEIREKLIPQLDKKVAVLEVKSSIFGTVGGVIGGFLALLLPHKV